MTWHAGHDLAGVPDVVTLSSPHASSSSNRSLRLGSLDVVEELSHIAGV